MSDITMFTAYSQRENIVTNNTLLLLKTIYNDSVLVFDRLISRLIGLDSLGFGLSIEQQVGFKTVEGVSIGDGLIRQEPISIFLETKTTDWFYRDQINRYRDFLAGPQSGVGRKILILLSNFESKDRLQKEVLEPLSDGRDEDVRIEAVGFDELLKAVQEEVKSENDVIRTMIVDFEKYLVDEGLLPTWAGTLVIIPMGSSLELNKQFQCYSCPNQGRGFTHSRAKFMGFYNQKKIDEVAEIDAVLELKSRAYETWEIRWNNSGRDEKSLMTRASEIIAKQEYYANNDFEQGSGILLFLLSNMQSGVNFHKTSPGGIMGRRYMKFQDIKIMDDLLAKIKNKPWRNVKDLG